MKVLILGATGRVGIEAIQLAKARGHSVTAFVRDPKKLRSSENIDVALGDLSQAPSVDQALSSGIEAVLNAAGVDPLKPSSFVTDTARIVVDTMRRRGINRYVGVSGTVCMKKTMAGRLSTAFLGMTPVRHAMRDHQGAFDIVSNSGLTWTLSGCPWIKDGVPPGHYTEANIFPGGLKTIAPEDVADFLTKALDGPAYYNRIVGIWHV